MNKNLTSVLGFVVLVPAAYPDLNKQVVAACNTFYNPNIFESYDLIGDTGIERELKITTNYILDVAPVVRTLFPRAEGHTPVLTNPLTRGFMVVGHYTFRVQLFIRPEHCNITIGEGLSRKIFQFCACVRALVSRLELENGHKVRIFGPSCKTTTKR